MEFNHLIEKIEHIIFNETCDRVMIPIQQIQHINVDCFIKFCGNNTILEFRGNGLYNPSSFQDMILCNSIIYKIDRNIDNKTNAENVLQALVETINNISFCKSSNNFDVENTEYKLELYKYLFSKTTNKDIKYLYDECCVCYEHCITKIYKCNHSLCVQCYSQLNKKECPICKEPILTIVRNDFQQD